MSLRSPRAASQIRSRGALLLAGALLLPGLLGTSGCGARAEPPAARQQPSNGAKNEAEWTWLQRTAVQLAERRARLAAVTDPKLQDPKLQKETDTLADEFNRRLAESINADPPVQGEPLTPRQKAALGLKSDEEIQLAGKYLDQGGDFQRAIDILQQALAIDGDNPRLKAELARVQARRYMTRETFAQAQKGMAPDEVRHLLGAPNLNNVRAYPDHNVVGWFYPRDAAGAAAAVWFHREEGKMVVYLTDFDALRPPVSPAPPAAAGHGAVS
ncbi:MAG TPA: tetratricopeptide repeat protein [Thermoanaerobaculia bacterium]|nr:tetratricopeptide repeat protein [Thermoanaerobaculia bacterium]